MVDHSLHTPTMPYPYSFGVKRDHSCAACRSHGPGCCSDDFALHGLVVHDNLGAVEGTGS